MSTVTRRGTAAAVADVFEDLQPLLRNAAQRYARQTGEDFDEAYGAATLLFVEVYHGHNPEESDLPQRVDFLLRNRMTDLARRWAISNARLRRAAADPNSLASRPEPERCPLGRISARVGPDERRLLALLFDTPPALEAAIRNDPRPGPVSIRRHLFRYARRAWGWNRTKTATVFSRISDAL